MVATQPANHLTTEQWQEAMKHATSNAFQVGHAQGELYGRQTLAAEIQRDFSADGTRDFTPADALTIRLKQVH